MPTRIVKDEERALALARKYRPQIYQEFSSVFDLIAPISIDKLEEVIKDFAVMTSKPTLNFGVREDAEYVYIYYMVYHAFDVCFHPIRFVRKLDSHRHDTEAILLRVKKKDETVDMLTVNHYRFKTEKHTTRRVVIEREGHGIRPYSERGPGGNFIVYKMFDFFNLNSLKPAEWELMRKSFTGGAAMPDEQYDSVLMSSLSGQRRNRRGDIWKRPDQLFKMMRLKGWL